jgi:uncharacterized protein
MSLTLIAALAAFGVFAGVASGLLGVGGGTVMVPFLTLVVGYSQQRAEATSLLVILPTAIVGVLLLRRKGIGDLPRALTTGAIGAAGGALGATLALALPSHVLRIVFAAFLGAIGVRMCRDALAARRPR